MERNNLYPIFLKLRELNILIVGGGNVAEEKLHFLLKSSPDAQVSLVAPMFRTSTLKLAKSVNAQIIYGEYRDYMLLDKHIVIATTDKKDVNEQVYKDCKERNILVNVADNPPFCDFYMGGIVTKGNVKMAISTNGKSPTAAKRLRQFFEESLPDSLDELVTNLNTYRYTLANDFEHRVEQLNKVTKSLITNKEIKYD
ncbi:precorrin-2 dehydrogenase/sirohydrochlorin ferrochelatase family protein [Aegicerativicinus sediminis]|uniref:precorrin-2 dehydrogenase/sirohydrochlorin ferrochelatase family protein n=1 Tax=Aegicerativicinus sediminis TaxID=2893202 RepID=UPI001E4386F8|nr:bifunctional precorrin-2 dehydrogenase/sirohydrochlorin ferrochelatase [Aegicerativicinus sediminis]